MQLAVPVYGDAQVGIVQSFDVGDQKDDVSVMDPCEPFCRQFVFGDVVYYRAAEFLFVSCHDGSVFG